MDGIGGFEQIIEELHEISIEESDFYKKYPEAQLINLEQSKELKLLSSFHNWFIFEKV